MAEWGRRLHTVRRQTLAVRSGLLAMQNCDPGVREAAVAEFEKFGDDTVYHDLLDEVDVCEGALRRAKRRGKDTRELKKELEDAKAKLTAFTDHQRRTRRRLVELANGSFPELWVTHSAALVSRVVDQTGLAVDRVLNDFDDVRPLAKVVPGVSPSRHALLVGTLDGDRYVLKRYDTSDADRRRELQRSVAVLHKLDCPGVVRVAAIFHDTHEGKPCSYVQMHMVGQGVTLREWLRTRLGAGDLTAGDIKLAFLRLVESVRAIHAAGVAHADLKLINVVMDHAGTPVLIDFDLAREPLSVAQFTMTTDASSQGSAGFIAPEVQGGARPTLAADMWALGVMLVLTLRAYSATDASLLDLDPPFLGQLLSMRDRLDIPVSSLGGVEHASHVVRQLIARSPGKRICIDDLRQHPFFHDISDRTSAPSVSRVALLRRLLTSLQRPRPAGTFVNVRLDGHTGAAIVNAVLDAMPARRSAEWRWRVTYAGEDGVDDGGLTRQMYTDVVAALASATSEASGDYLNQWFRRCSNGALIPRADVSPEVMRRIGRFLYRSVVDGAHPDLPLHATVWRFITLTVENIALPLSKLARSMAVREVELESYDHALWSSLERLRVLPDLPSLELDYASGGVQWEDPVNTEVTAGTVGEYIRRSRFHQVVGRRLEQLRALRLGLREDGPDVWNLQLEASHGEDLQAVLGAPAVVRADDVLRVIRFGVGAFGEAARQEIMRGHLGRWLRSQECEDAVPGLRAWLLFVHGQCHVPRGGIVLHSTARMGLPVAMTCSASLELRFYDAGEGSVFGRDMERAVREAGSAFMRS